MREIKFRGKRVDNGEWVIGNYLKRYDSFGEIDVIEAQDRGSFEINRRQVVPETVGQWTGLYDKSGNPIYEGDILAQDCSMVDDYTGETSIEVLRLIVRWSESDLRWAVYCPSAVRKSNWRYIPRDAFVVGNIYEHSEQLS